MVTARSVPLLRRFHIRLTLLYALPVLGVLAAAGVIAYRQGVASEVRALQGRLRGLAVLLSRTITAEQPGLEDTFAAIAAEEPDIASIYVLEPTDRPGILRFAVDWVRHGYPAAPGDDYDARELPDMLDAFHGPRFEEEPTADEWGLTLSGYAPIRDRSGQAIAIVGVDVSADRIAAIERGALVTTLALFGAAALLLAVLGALVGRSVRDPIARLIAGSDAIAAGRLDTRIGLTRSDELGLVGRRFDQMAATLDELEHIRATFGRYVSEDVARRVLASPEATKLGGDEREITIVFADIKSYSTIAEQLPPAQVVDILNRYLGAMGELIDEHGGCIIEFMGDAILAVFGAPEPSDDHAARAVACARAMNHRLDELNRGWEEAGLAKAWQDLGVPKLAARIGVHTGRVVAGNMGSKTRIKYGVVGDAVNVAARVESLNTALGTTLLITADVHDRLPATIAAAAIDHGAHAVKGRDRPVEVYTFASQLDGPLPAQSPH